MHGSAMAVTILAAALMAQSQPPPPSQPQRPVFKTGVNYVEVDANVLDARGEFVGDLTKDDFTVVEDGKVQTVSVFSTVDIPIEVPEPPSEKSGPPLPTDFAVNKPFKGRVYALLLDEQQTTPAGTHRVREAARSFVTRFVSDGDLVAVAGTLGTAAQVLTSDRARVLKAIDRFMGLQGQTMAAAGEADDIINLGLPAKVADAAVNVFAEGQLRERRSNGRRSLGTIEALANYLARIPDRRKAMVLIGGGFRDITDDRDLQEDLQHAIQAANRANVAIYGVDVRGLPEAGTSSDAASSGSSALHTEFQSGQEGISVVSRETGGVATINANNLDPGLSRIMKANSQYYVLGYYPRDDPRDGKFHSITLKVSRPGLTVNARRGYVAPDGKKTPQQEAVGRASPELATALASLVPVSDVTMRLTAAPFRHDASKTAVSITLELDAKAFEFTHSGDAYADRLEVVVLSRRPDGKVHVETEENIDLTLRANYEDVRARGIRLGTRVELSPGHCRLLVGVRETNGGAIGTVPLDIDVPDLSRGAVALSGIVLTSMMAAQVPTTHADLTFKDVLPAPPTARREFSRDDVLTSFAEVYNNHRGASEAPVMSAQILAADNAVVYDSVKDPAAVLKKKDAGTYRFLLRIPLKPLEEGHYRLRFTASSNGSKPVSRETSLWIH